MLGVPFVLAVHRARGAHCYNTARCASVLLQQSAHAPLAILASLRQEAFSTIVAAGEAADAAAAAGEDGADKKAGAAADAGAVAQTMLVDPCVETVSCLPGLAYHDHADMFENNPPPLLADDSLSKHAGCRTRSTRIR